MADIDLIGQDRIRIPDLASPDLSPIQRDTLASTAANPVTISLDRLLAAARERTGLDDFGDPDFVSRAEAWIEATNDDIEMTEFGRTVVWNEMVRFAATRLYVEDELKRHPEALEVQLEPSLIVAGLPRSGTTFLLQVLAGDRRLRSLPYWEAVRPVAWPYLKDGTDTRLDLCTDECAAGDRLVPLSKMFHEFSPEHISEDQELQCIDFGSYYLEWLSRVPGWRDYYFAHDQTPVYRYMAKMFQLLSWYSKGPNRWVTKCPQHMEQLLSVERALPGSTIIITHRDPVASIQSAMYAQAYRARVKRRHVDLDEISTFWIDRYQRLLRACAAERDQLDENRTHDIYFHELMASPLDVIEDAYAKTDLPFTDACRSDLTQAIANNPRAKHGAVVYDLRADFGLDPADLRKRFDFYFERFPKVKIEVK